MGALIEMIRGIRNVRSEYEVDPARRIKALVQPGNYRTLIAEHAALFARLAHVNEIAFLAAMDAAPAQAASVVVGDATIYLPLAGMIDLEAEQQRLSKELDMLISQLERSAKLLGNPDFVNRAKPDVVERERAKLNDLSARREALEKRLKALQG
ncbi:MAG: Valine--tRNA ligase [Syntrophus sp. PtaU1.Bin208]|nr:MAG: Valine--tRNA ligase [Syntrophus sp. PtaU1.Bin208]